MSRPRDGLPPCARCGAEIGDHEETLEVWSKTHAEVDAQIARGEEPDLGELLEAYCERCTQEIEEAHLGHDAMVETFKRELDEYKGDEERR